MGGELGPEERTILFQKRYQQVTIFRKCTIPMSSLFNSLTPADISTNLKWTSRLSCSAWFAIKTAVWPCVLLALVQKRAANLYSHCLLKFLSSLEMRHHTCVHGVQEGLQQYLGVDNMHALSPAQYMMWLPQLAPWACWKVLPLARAVGKVHKNMSMVTTLLSGQKASHAMRYDNQTPRYTGRLDCGIITPKNNQQ